MAVLTPRNLHIVSLHLVLLDENNISCSQNNRMPVLRINRVTDVISEEKITAQCQSQKIKTRSRRSEGPFKRFLIVDDSRENHAMRSRNCKQI